MAPSERAYFAGLLAVAIWQAPTWAQNVLAFLRDLRDYRNGQ